MQYLLLIYSSEAEEAKMPAETLSARMADYGVFTKSIVDAGAYVGGNRLRPTTDATSVRLRGGKAMVTDGPFAETREALGGYYLIEAKDLDQATEIASR